MSTFLGHVEHGMTTNAFFQALMGSIWTQLQSQGWNLSSDTGQTDPNSATLPSAGAFAGYSIFKPSDALTAFYVKLEWGRGTSNQPTIRVQVGTGTNGSGTLTGQISTQTSINGAVTSGVFDYYVSATSNRMSIVLAASSSAQTQGFVIIGRSVDGSGTSNNDAIETWFFANPISTGRAQAIPYSGTVPPQETFWPGVILSRNPPTIGTSVPVGICVLPTENGLLNPSELAGLYSTGNAFVTNTATSFTLYGVTKQYLVMNVSNIGAAGAWSALIRYQ